MNLLKEVWYTEIKTLDKEENVNTYSDAFDTRNSAIRHLITYRPKKNEQVVSFHMNRESSLDL